MAQDRKVPDLLLEQLALGELPPQASRDLTVGPDETRRLEALQASDQAILKEHPPGQVAQAIQGRLARSRTPDRPRVALAWGLAGLGAAALVAVLAWFAWPALVAAPEPGQDPAGLGDPGTERVKINHPLLQVFRQRSGAAEQLRPGVRVSSGDRLQIRYNAMGERNGVILSVDGRGSVSLHFPERAGDSTALPGRGIQSLAHSYQLDDAPGFERFIFVSSDEPIDTQAVLTAARGVGPTDPLKLALGLRQHDFLVWKGGSQ